MWFVSIMLVGYRMYAVGAVINMQYATLPHAAPVLILRFISHKLNVHKCTGMLHVPTVHQV